jgi:dihydropteroate synthase
MQKNPHYDDVIDEIKQFFIQRIKVCEDAGIKRERIIIDPGFGFGKTLDQNYQLLAQLHQFDDLSLPLLSGTSRKSMIGDLLMRNIDERLAGSITTAIIAAQKNASIIRVHDVKETVDALKVLAMATKYQ